MKQALVSIVNEFGPNSAPVGDLAFDASEHLRLANQGQTDNVYVTKSYQPGGLKPRRLLNAAKLFCYLPWYMSRRKIQGLQTGRRVIVIAITTPPLLHWLAILVGKLLRIDTYVWYQDAHPYLTSHSLKNRLPMLGQALIALDRLILRGARGFIALDQSMKQHLVGCGVPATKISIAPPWTTYMSPPAPIKGPVGGPLKLIYAGNYGKAHDLSPLTTQLAQLSYPQQRAFELHFLGLSSQAQTQITELCQDVECTIKFHPRLPHRDQVGSFLRQFDLGIVCLKSEYFGYACPSKAFSYLSQGLPILYVGEPDTLAFELVQQGYGVLPAPQLFSEPHHYIHNQIKGRIGQIFLDPKSQSQETISSLILS